MKIIITGANRGIGFELAKYYSLQGHNVTSFVRKPSEEILKLPIQVVENVDVSDEEKVNEAISSLQGTKIDLLINNAGIMGTTTLENMDSNAIKKQFDVNALAPLIMSNKMLPLMNENSKIVMITSRMGSIQDNSSGGSYGYRMSKAALNAAAKSLALDLRDRKVSVGILHPGWVQTSMTANSGHLSAEQSALLLKDRIEQLNLENSGTFWHCDGSKLPW